jgi:uncharacterized protein (DUF58 family)
MRSAPGVLRDLEGRTTNDTSLSDLAFQALREYVPGDDQRHIHWGATATRSSLSGSTSLMVRQFLDTRRTHAGIILDASRGAYADDGEFEVAVQVAASLAQRAVRDKVDLSQASGSLVLTYAKGHMRPWTSMPASNWGTSASTSLRLDWHGAHRT